VRPFAFAGGYLLAWALPGLAAYGLYALGRAQLSDALSWHAGGRWTAGAVLLLAAAYELTPVKRAFLSRCRRLPRPPRAGPAAALAAGAAHAGWCVGCCLGLMTALFALGVMSLTWMIVLAALVAVQKLLPWPGRATLASTAVLALLSAGLLASPQSVPGLVVPGSAHRHAGGAMQMPAAMHMPHAGHLPAAAHVRATAPAPAVKR
jgi:predicted metal-binding membrane protein